jgi:signal transduction histidine kinase
MIGIVPRDQALACETAERVRLATQRVEVRAESERLRLLQGITELMGIGVIRIGIDGPVAENAVMAAFAGIAKGLEPFLTARTRGEDTLEVGEGAAARIFKITLAGAIEAGMILVEDVTARVTAKRQLNQAKETLERRVADRTRALEAEVAEHIQAQHQLELAKEQAELANRAKTELLANISHELRTPLNAIIGFSEIMTSELFGPLGSERYRSYAEDIHGSGRHLLAVINDILDIAKIEAGEMVLEIQDVDVADVAGAALRIVEGRAEAGGVDLRADLAADLPSVAADRRRLLQILVNLLSNAIKFTAEGGSVRIGAEVVGRWLAISVADTGIGMTDDEVALALQPFRQVDGGLARRYEGTGLGLPLAKSFVDMHGGSLQIASAKGRGTTVTVRLPHGAAGGILAA